MKDLQIQDHIHALRQHVARIHATQLDMLLDLERSLIQGPDVSLIVPEPTQGYGTNDCLERNTDLKPRPKPERSDRPTVKRVPKNARKPEILEAAKRMGEIITSAGLAAEAGISSKDASNFIQRWRQNGWLSDESPRHYRKADSFGVLDTPTKRGEAMLANIHNEIAAKKGA